MNKMLMLNDTNRTKLPSSLIKNTVDLNKTWFTVTVPLDF